jgi:hypothetical protein
VAKPELEDQAADTLEGLVLALDAGSPIVSVAAGLRGVVLAARAVPLERSSTQLLALVDEVLAAAGARAADLAGVVALAGPGSFTGLRVGLATALGLHQALGLRALALPTLAAMAAMAAASGAPPGALVIAAVDALRGEWSAQAFRAGDPMPLMPPALPPAPFRFPASSGFPPALVSPLPPLSTLSPGSPGASSSSLSPPQPERPGPPIPLGAMALLPAGELLRLLAPGGGAAAMTGEAAAWTPARQGPPWIVAFGAAALRQAAGAEAAGASFLEAAPLAPAALWLAAAMPAARWQAARLAQPIYSRPPATTAPRRRPPPEAPGPPDTPAAPGRGNPQSPAGAGTGQPGRSPGRR